MHSRPPPEPLETTCLIPGPRPGMSLLTRRLGRSDPERPSAGIVLYVHGATFPSALSIAYRFHDGSWRDALCRAGFEVWAFDFYGFGGSSRYPEQSKDASLDPPLGRAADAAEQLSAVVRFVLHAEGAQRLSIISHSWGSMPVGLLAAADPSVLDRWVLFGPIGRREPPADASAPALPAWRAVSLEDQWTRFIEDVPDGEPPVLPRSDFDPWGEAYLDSDPGSRERSPPAVNVPLGPFSEIADAWQGHLAWNPTAVTAAVAIVRGAWDGLTSDEDARWLFDAFSQARERRDVKIGRGTHLMHLEEMRPALWRESIAFLTPHT